MVVTESTKCLSSRQMLRSGYQLQAADCQERRTLSKEITSFTQGSTGVDGQEAVYYSFDRKCLIYGHSVHLFSCDWRGDLFTFCEGRVLCWSTNGRPCTLKFRKQWLTQRKICPNFLAIRCTRRSCRSLMVCRLRFSLRSDQCLFRPTAWTRL